MSKYDVIKGVAHKIWEIFEKEEMSNTPDGNWCAAEAIVERIINGTYKLEEFRNMLTVEDENCLNGLIKEYVEARNIG